MITKVVFRRYPNGEIVALFPELPAVPQGFLCVSYQHIGQHGAADYGLVVAYTTLAPPFQYAELKQELEEHGYDLIIYKRRPK